MSTVSKQLSRHVQNWDHTGDCRAVPKALLIEMTFSPAEFLGLSLTKGLRGKMTQTARSLHPDDRQNLWCLSLTLIWRCWSIPLLHLRQNTNPSELLTHLASHFVCKFIWPIKVLHQAMQCRTWTCPEGKSFLIR